MAQDLILLEPATRDYAFGGRRLERYGKRLDGRTAETWEFSLYPGRESHLTSGERLDAYVERAFALAAARAELPLVKLLDVQGDLPVHCHPGDVQARALDGDDPGKDEAWLVLEAGPEAAVYLGFAQPLDDEAILEAIRGEGLRPHMVRFTPRVGDVIMVPTGTAHSARDVVLYEVQQTSDRAFIAETVDLWQRPFSPERAQREHDGFVATVRRTPPDGLWLRDVLAAAGPDEALPLVGCDHFAAEVWTLEGTRLLPPGAYTVLSGRVGTAGQAGVGSTFVAGPEATAVSSFQGPARLVRAWSADSALTARLRAVGRHFEG
jgi:mannose-6-phosphate isomerase class I